MADSIFVIFLLKPSFGMPACVAGQEPAWSNHWKPSEKHELLMDVTEMPLQLKSLATDVVQPKYSILGCSIDQSLTSHIHELRPCWLCKLLLMIMEKNHFD